MDQDQTTAPPAQGCIFCTVVEPQLNHLIEHMWPEDAREHFHNARIEVLKGVRSLIDARIQRLSKQEKKGTKVTVE